MNSDEESLIVNFVTLKTQEMKTKADTTTNHSLRALYMAIACSLLARDVLAAYSLCSCFALDSVANHQCVKALRLHQGLIFSTNDFNNSYS